MARLIISISSLSLIVSVVVVISTNVDIVQGRLNTPIFAFGDSFYDTGNSNQLSTATMRANVSPYGESFFHKPAGRFCDGRLIPDFIAEYGNVASPPAFLQPGLMSFRNGVDFACAGAGALNTTFQGRVISLPMQVENYKKVIVKLRQQFGHGISQAMLTKAVYIFNVGTNDYLYPLSTNPALLNPQYISTVVGNITTAINEIYRLGGRKFTINNVGPLGCFPVVKAALNYSGTCVPQVTQLVSSHNLQLTQALSTLATQNKGLKYGLFDMYTNLEKWINSPTTYGFKESTKACCGAGPYRGIFSCGGQGNLTTFELCPNPKEYIFWDSVHPSEKTYNKLADLIWAGSPSDIGPYNLKSLFLSS